MSNKVNLVIEQGDTFNTVVTLIDDSTRNPVDLTSYTAIGALKKSYLSNSSIPLNVALGNTSGTITLSLASNVTSTMWPIEYVYDVHLTDLANNIIKVLEGIAAVIPSAANTQ